MIKFDLSKDGSGVKHAVRASVMDCKKLLGAHECKLGSSVLQVGLQDKDLVSKWARSLAVSYPKSC